MKTITVPRHQSHVLTYGVILCVICKQVCNRLFPCYCHQVAKVTERRDEEAA